MIFYTFNLNLICWCELTMVSGDFSDLDDNNLAHNEDGTTRQSHGDDMRLSSYLNGPSQHTFQGDSDFQGGMLNIGSDWCTCSPTSTEVSEEGMNTSRTMSTAQQSQQLITQQGSPMSLC